MNDALKTVKVVRPLEDSLSSQLVALYKTLQNLKPNEQVTFDFSPITWVNPLLILPLAAYIHTTKSSYVPASSIHNYFAALQFPHGARTVSELQQKKSYIPIGLLTREDPVNRDKLGTAFVHLLNEVIGAVPRSENAIFYPIDEFTTNIFDHSKKDEGWILAQWYPTKQYLDLCIVDCGRGMSGVYKEEMGLQLTDAQAIMKALSGLSTKKDRERGFGMRTSKDVVCKALGGSFVLVSGSSALISTQEGDKMVRLPNFNWQGVIVSYRIPKPTGPVDITPYLE